MHCKDKALDFAVLVLFAIPLMIPIVMGHTAIFPLAATLMAVSMHRLLFHDRSSMHTGGASWSFLRELWIWRLPRWYFGFQYDHTDRAAFAKRKKDKDPFVFAIYPHSLVNISTVLGACMVAPIPGCPHRRPPVVAVSRAVFSVPLLNTLALWAGAVDASPKSLNHAIDHGKDVWILPEGKKGAGLLGPNRLELYVDPDRKVKEHNGFLKFAWDKKTPVVPVYSDNENKVFWTAPWLPATAVDCIVSKIGMFIPLFIGPLPTNITACLGTPITPTKFATYKAFETRFYHDLCELIHNKRRPNHNALGTNLQALMNTYHHDKGPDGTGPPTSGK